MLNQEFTSLEYEYEMVDETFVMSTSGFSNPYHESFNPAHEVTGIEYLHENPDDILAMHTNE